MPDPVSPDPPSSRHPVPPDTAAPGRLASLGWSERVETLFASSAATDPIPARVVRVDRDRCLVVTAVGESTASSDPLPAVGDWVLLSDQRPSDPPFVVSEVLPRWSVLARHTAGRETVAQVLAANIDVVAVVTALDRPVNHSRMDRELVMAWETGARPVVILTKADACPDPDGEAAEVAQRHASVEVAITSAVERTGIDQVSASIRPGDTVVLIGASGVGKSTLANALLGSDLLDTGAVRTGDHRGRHTTTARHLLAIPGGGVLIDTPGMRSLGLYEADDGVALTFPDIEELSHQCRFANCSHGGDAGCAIAAAVVDGTLDADRLQSWEKLQRELAWVARQRDGRAAAEHGKRIRRFARSIKDLPHR